MHGKPHDVLATEQWCFHPHWFINRLLAGASQKMDTNPVMMAWMDIKKATRIALTPP
jgi:hypothetical protein